MNLFHNVLDVPSAGFAMQKNLELADVQIYPLTLEKTVTSATSLAAVPVANLLLGTTLILTFDNILYVYRLANGTDANNPPRIVRPTDYSSSNQRVWKWIQINALAPCADNGMLYPILVKIINGYAQTYLGAPI